MGAIRFILASLVVLQHIGGVPFVGAHAVVFFFVISGYLMTLVMHGSYGYSLPGFSRFWKNRILRLYPAYFFVAGLTVLVILLMGDAFANVRLSALGIPADLSGWLQNITMVFWNIQPNMVEPRISPATWALTTELCFYALISLGLSRTRMMALGWFAISVVYTVYGFFQDQAFEYVYLTVTGGSLPFSCGALLYHYRDETRRFTAGRETLLVSGLFGALLVVMAARLGLRLIMPADTANAAAIVLTILVAVGVTATVFATSWRFLPKWLDKILGDLSYPIYICHWLSALVIGSLLGFQYHFKGAKALAFAGCTLALSCLIGLIIVHLIDRQVETVRGRIRSGESTPVTA